MAAVAALAGIVSGSAQAQERPGSVYATGGVTVSHQSGVSGETRQAYVAAPGGTVLGWTVGGGVYLNGGVSVEGELASSGVMSAREPSRYGMTFNEDRRDRYFGVNVRLHRPSSSAVHLEPVIGFFVVQRTAWSQTEFDRSWPRPPQELFIEPRRPRDLPDGVGVTTGLDLRVGGRHLAVVPSVRVRVASRVEDSVYPGGDIGSWTFAFGAAGRIDF